MSRPTLKLPKKPATGDRETPGRARKPIRRGSPASKHAAARRVDGKWAVPAVPADADKRTPARFRGDATGTDRSQPARVEAVAAPQRDSTAAAPERGSKAIEQVAEGPGEGRPDGRFPEAGGPPANGRPHQRSKTYPQRGIARSTGARAFPPPPRRSEGDLPAPAGRQSGPPALAPALQVPATAVPETPATTTRMPRGLPKESPRLSRLVSELAACSRREADEWIENGWVSVDGVVVARLGARVSPKAKIGIKDVASRHQTESVTILFNKPCDPAEAAVEDDSDNAVALIRSDNHWPEDSNSCRFQATHLRGLALAGRIENDEGGMLVFTQSGSVARRLTGGDSRLEKEYHVRVEGELPPDGLERLRHGLTLDKVKLLPAQVSWLSEQQLRFVLHESRKRQIRGMCEQLGLRATTIKRVRIGSVSLGKLAAGQWRYLRADERF
ncbi:MAG: pseudouridine synthase [Candidatus Accumulibacter sp.]|nr:pseudouridine synthase [Accumulibacter sp.]